jgi:hypothetical protein
MIAPAYADLVTDVREPEVGGATLRKTLEGYCRHGPVPSDRAHDTRSCHAAAAAREAMAVIPIRRNGHPWKETTPGAQARSDTRRASRRFGRAIRRSWSGYQRRSLIEAKMRCMKLLGERLMARTSDCQIAELQIRAALPNRFTALGTPETVRVT